MLNIAAFVGRLTADPELKTTTTGTPVCSFTVAVDRSYVKSGEERQADFIDVVAWRGTAEFVERYFKKGSMIAIDGSIQTRTYEDKNGKKQKVTEIVANGVNFCGSKEKTESEPKANPMTIEKSEPYVRTPNLDDYVEDDLPF